MLDVSITPDNLMETLLQKTPLRVRIAMVKQGTMERSEPIAVSIGWKELEDHVIDDKSFTEYVLGVCSRTSIKRRLLLKLLSFFIHRVSIQFHPIFGWEVKFVKGKTD